MRKRFVQLLIGPGVAIIIGILAGPIISRLYDPADFGLYSLLIALVGVGAVTGTLRFEQLIPSCQDPEANFWIALLCSLLFSLLAAMVALIFFSWEYAFFIGVTIFLLALFNACYYILVASDQVIRASSGRIAQAGGILAGQGLLGAGGLGILGLLWGEVIGRSAAVMVAYRRVPLRSFKRLKSALNDQLRPALWLLGSATVGVSALQFLPLGMPSALGPAAAGVFMLVYRMVVVPNALISKVASDTFLVEIGRMHHKKDRLKPLAEKGVQKLVFAAFGLYGILALHSPWLFPMFLGDGWELSGLIAPWLCLLVACWSLASPMASVFIALGKTQWSFFLSLLDISNRAVAVFVGAWSQDIVTASVSLAVGGVVVYGLSLMLSLRLCGTNPLRALYPERWWIAATAVLWIAAAFLQLSDYFVASVCLSSVILLVVAKKVLHG